MKGPVSLKTPSLHPCTPALDSCGPHTKAHLGSSALPTLISQTRPVALSAGTLTGYQQRANPMGTSDGSTGLTDQGLRGSWR